MSQSFSKSFDMIRRDLECLLRVSIANENMIFTMTIFQNCTLEIFGVSYQIDLALILWVCVCGYKDGVVEHIRSYDRLWGIVGGSLNPMWGRNNYLWQGYLGWFDLLFSCQGSTVSSTCMYGLHHLCDRNSV